ncbi:exosortase [Thalassotalea mangrovi]|uniref:Exosortase n=1 Tax=Thalassotalea mangrovi TaxID=2572245 RepID=A0A4U1B9F9_9GAMM|nr:exosortase [Thalassotalea mangrovi]TKB46642.1 exosortase [Thalassotalea mangrovi]
MEKLLPMQVTQHIIYRPLYVLFALFAFIGLMNMPILVTLWRHSFDDGTYSHAFLIPVISAYLLFDAFKQGKIELRDKFSFLAFFLFLISCVCLFATVRAQMSLGYWLSLLMLLSSASIMLFKPRLALLFPTLYLIFLMPLWGAFTTFLQDMSVAAATGILHFTDIPIYVKDQFISLPAGTFEIANGCSGLRYLLVSLAISSLYVFLYIRNWRSATIFFTFAILGALITNWIRIVSLILIGQYTNMESELMHDHNNFGWYLYVPFMVILFYLGNKLADEPEEQTIQKPAATKPNLTATLLTLVMVSLCSSALLMINRQPINNMSGNQALPSPDIKFYSSLSQRPLPGFEDTGIEQVYQFYCDDLDCKPSYYANVVLPQGWQVVEFRDHKQFAEYVLQQGRRQAHLQLWYQRQDFRTSNVKRFKLMRSKSFLTSNENDKLIWQFRFCDMDCEPLLANEQQE